ncbi:MAG: sodium:proton antiporter [Deltaproteobacteria bacterium]|nr:sodium:proton antiporter [Deltaproteobacteria bacterium]
MRNPRLVALGVLGGGWVALGSSVALASGGAEAGGGLGASLPLFSGIPFAGILLSIALFPLLAPRFWHHHFGKVTAFWGLVLAVPFLISHRGEALYEIAHVYLADYVPFLILLWSLFTIAGGILVSGRLAGSPAVNTVLLLLGTLIASWVGTTGAAMLLVRPFLRANAWRKKRAYQVVFFIFLVCNVGGALTPLGDPPLFLGFLHGVPFFWTFALLPHMGVVALLLLALFYLLDTLAYRREEGSAPAGDGSKLRVEGASNLLYLGGVVLAVLVSGVLHLGEASIFGVHRATADLLRDGVLILLGLASLTTTPRALRERNEFSWAPIQEVAILFAGIFVTMIPVILILKAGSHGAMAFLLEAVKRPAHYFWASGVLSSFLDNAPTYLVFLNTQLGNFFSGVPEREAIASLIREKAVYLQAVSAGAVFMGANTYIGNAPNFMVRSIAEEAGVEMPSFFGYIFKYSLPMLVPCFVIVTFIFFA